MVIDPTRMWPADALASKEESEYDRLKFFRGMPPC